MLGDADGWPQFLSSYAIQYEITPLAYQAGDAEQLEDNGCGQVGREECRRDLRGDRTHEQRSSDHDVAAATPQR